MKKYFLVLVFIFSYLFIEAQDVFIYNENGSKIYFNKIDSIIIVNMNIPLNYQNIEIIKSKISSIPSEAEEITPLSFKIKLTSVQKQNIISQLGSDTSKIYFSNMLIYSDSTVQWESNKIFVQILPSVDLSSILNEYSIPYSNFIQFGSDLNTYLVTLEGMENKSIEYSNILYESKKVVYAQPSFWREIKPHNPLYPNQWGLNNIGQSGGVSGIDINAASAWNLSIGSNIKVAVIDEGVDLTHSDLINNMLPGYDATDGALGGVNGGYKGSDSHGTSCAGIIAAEDNMIGIKGISYNAKIIPIRIAYGNAYGWVTNDSWIVDGLKKAWYNLGADVLSNSWGGGANSGAINTEINNALTQGRNGKGSVIVFSSGNNNASSVNYPSNLNGVISVGAIDRCGVRAGRIDIVPQSCDPWCSNCQPGSAYGSALSIVAPGTSIPTTDIGNSYVNDFGGTSAACPHVAGVAALILSVNPNLTQQEVRNIIESTAQKVRPDLYTYSVNSNHPNGTWNNQMGYGLVDAYAAVQMAKCYNGEDVLVNVINTNTDINTNTFARGEVTIKSGNTLTLTSTLSMAPDAKIIVEPGAKLIVNGGTITNACPDEFWAAIFVVGDRNQPQTQQYQGYVELNNATIENARNAISTWYPGNWNTTGGIIKATNTTFKNNLRSVEYLSYNNSNPNQGLFTNCTFSWDENLFAHDKSQLTHVTMYDVLGVKFIKCYFSKDDEYEEGNTILTHGILSEEAGFEVNGRFEVQDMNLVLKKSMFNNLDYGMRASNGNGKIFNVSNSIFNYNSCGVFSSSVNDFKVTNSTFNIRPNFDPFVNPNADYIKTISVGVSSDNSTGYTIINNEFNGISFPNQSFPPANTVGVDISNSGELSNIINNNSFDNLYGGTQALGTNRQENNLFRVGLRYYCNTFSNSLYGLYVTKHNANNPNIYGICEEQGSISVPALNFFNNNIVDICNKNCPKIYYSFASNIPNIEPTLCNDNLKLIDIAPQENNCGIIGATRTKAEWYNHIDLLRDQYALLLFNYNNLLDGGQKDELLDKLQEGWDGDVWAVRDEYLGASPYLSVEVLREMVQSEKLPLAVCTEILLSNPEATQKDEFKEFMYNEENYLNPLSISLIEESWENETFRASVESNISAKFTELEMASRSLIGIILTDSLGVNINEYRSVLSEMKSPATRFELADSYIGKQEYPQARESLSSLLGNNNYTDKVERYLEYIDLVEEVGNAHNLSKETLLYLSEYNDAIGSKAKSILYFKGINTDYHPIVVNMEKEPENKSIRVKGSLSDLTNTEITIAPNPAKNHITITYNLPPKQTYNLKIYDNKGVELFTKTLNGNKGMQTIELINLKSGSYYYTVSNSKNVVKSDKIIIVN